MLNFKTASFLFIIAVTGVICLHYSMGFSWWWLLPVLLAYKIRLILGSSRIDSNFHTQVYCEGKTGNKEIALTFDDGPSPFTKSVLETLSAYQAPATFFVIGKKIKGNEAILKQMMASGHTIGNHTFTHSFFIDFKTVNGFKRELNQTAGAVFDVIGKRTQFFRPPYGVTTPHLAKAARELDYHVIGWNIRSLDTTTDSEELIFKRVIRQLKPGAIILFHDTSEKTNGVLKRVLQYAKENQFEIVALEKLLQLNAYK